LDFLCNTETKTAIVSKIFDNADFGYHKIVVERPLRLNFQACAERIDRLDKIKAFAKLAESKKKDPIEKQREMEAGRALQNRIKAALQDMDASTIYKNRDEFSKELKGILKAHRLALSAPLL